MKVEKDFAEFIELLNKHDVKYIIVGAYALALYTEPRNTGDIDFFYDNDEENCKKLLDVLIDFGMESLDLTVSTLQEKDVLIQLGVAPVRIDLISSLSGITFHEAYKNKIETKFGNTSANFISKEMLIKNKTALGRKKDLSDLEMLGEN
jgi:hypothetical protein